MTWGLRATIVHERDRGEGVRHVTARNEKDAKDLIRNPGFGVEEFGFRV